MFLTAPVDYCASNPCHNGGTCEQLELSYLCVCDDKWTGRHCTQCETVVPLNMEYFHISYSSSPPHSLPPPPPPHTHTHTQLWSMTKLLRSRLVHRTPSRNFTVQSTSPVLPQEPQSPPSPGTRMIFAFQTRSYPSFSSQSYNSSTVGYTTVKHPIRFVLKVTQTPFTQGWIFPTK